ncbi:NrfD/PsrC family molybdoenzyme membrane anchor subunit [Hyperthermus butylicus]|uniref:Polysulfide reductase n=1 Tax=Hyperthermus butylicus (strain DSM 5456 / JCM 9403 / PLM1-5) TaxID=415426 RepID=A2BMK7_HYPBU|nr:NrfD/PsrC family molybdoenzyme membrane anchor subunit [Hyperthermus butylicus]ABM81218.1 putative Polysulfide reductase [Hyperthermus butylicus DSM 5456]
MTRSGGFLDTIKYVIREALLTGSPRYYMAFLGLLLVAAYGIYLWIFVQHAPIFLGKDEGGLILTNLSDTVPWGIYISFFVFWVGVAAAGIMFGIAAYVFGDKEFKKVAVLGEVQAVAAIITVLTLIMVDVGRPFRALILLPQLPNLKSMLDWDFIVLTTYLALNLIGVLVTVHYYRQDKPLPKKFIVPFIIIAAPFAIGIHTVTAFISQALTARPIWNSPLLAPRYVATAFASGPAILLIALYLAERYIDGFKVDFSVYKKTLYVIVGSLIVGLYFTFSEIHEIFWYTTESMKKAQAEVLFFGYHVPYLAILVWLWIGLGIAAVILGILPRVHNTKRGILLVSAITVIAVVAEKTMTIIIPGYIPGSLGEIRPYYPTPLEIGITIGVHALGILVYLLLARPALKAVITHYYKGGSVHH